jgi:hypothetical protein
VPKDYDHRHPEIDRECRQQKAIARYRGLKSFKESELNLEDKLFLENFEAAMHYLWGFRRAAITASSDAIPNPIGRNKAS